MGKTPEENLHEAAEYLLDEIQKIEKEEKERLVAKRQAITIVGLYIFTIGVLPILCFLTFGPFGFLVGIVIGILIAKNLFPHSSGL